MTTILVSSILAWILFGFLEFCLTVILELIRLARPSAKVLPVQGVPLALKLAPTGPVAVPLYLYVWRDRRGLAVALMIVHVPILGAFTALVAYLLGAH